MISETRLTIQEIDHTDGGAQLNENNAYVYYTSKVSVSTEARTSAAQLTADIPVVGDKLPTPGSMVILEATNSDGEFVKVFVGFIFTYSVDRYGVVTLTAYDALRYLQNPATGKWVGSNGVDVSDIVRDVVRSCGLKKMADEMEIQEVGVKPIRLIKIAEKGLDIIDEILEWAQLKATATENGVTTKGGSKYAATRAAERWVFFDNCGKLTLCTANQMAYKLLGTTEPPIIGSGIAMTEMSMNVSIDECANSVWLLRASDMGCSGWQVQDEDNIKKWGPIVYYEKIDNAYCRNSEQMKLRAAIELCTRDVEKRTIDISTFGVTGIRAGMLVRINIPWLSNYFGEISKSKLVFLDNVTHDWEEGTHMMSLKAEALPGDVDIDAWTSKVKGPQTKNKSSIMKQNSKQSSESEDAEENESFLSIITGGLL